MTAALKHAAPRERPILFSPEMVNAILAGRKTMTRRIIAPQPVQKLSQRIVTPEHSGSLPVDLGTVWLDPCDRIGPSMDHEMDYWSEAGLCPWGRPGERLWVREAWATVFDCPVLPCECEEGAVTHRRIVYRATDPNGTDGFVPWDGDEDDRVPWLHAVDMPRWASRIKLIITDVRVKRVRDISEDDVLALGFEGHRQFCLPVREERPALYDTPHSKRAWDLNDWCWVISFTRVTP